MFESHRNLDKYAESLDEPNEVKGYLKMKSFEKEVPHHPQISVSILLDGVELPKYETCLSSGFDLRAKLESTFILKPNSRKLVPTGIKLEIPKGYEVQVRSRSGLALKKGVFVLNSPGTIDADYRGDVGVILFNSSDQDFEICNGDRIAQGVLCPVFQANFNSVNSISNTDRGVGGFGSTGTK